MKEKLDAFSKVLQTMNRLREECPWDKKQTFESLRMLTIEEVHELSDAILNNSYSQTKEELGDLLIHIVFYAKIAEEKNEFTIKDVCDTLVDKLVERHPHIYGNIKLQNEDEVKQNWEKIKLKNGKKLTLEGVPKSLPSMIKAIRMQEKARGVGFDWDNRHQVWDKINEELIEFKEEIEKNIGNKDKIEEEFGDILFSLINYSRFYNVNPDNALERTNNKFHNRFNKMQEIISDEKKDLMDMPLVEMEKYWQKAKNLLG
ncbi:MAG: nucleoside triphosphate pyrophosphohydrolase [Bacteroidota bacterium]|nr:nucleoside triphosphate pyrophosphohydrolase [Bacteroidota bacterium]